MGFATALPTLYLPWLYGSHNKRALSCIQTQNHTAPSWALRTRLLFLRWRNVGLTSNGGGHASPDHKMSSPSRSTSGTSGSDPQPTASPPVDGAPYRPISMLLLLCCSWRFIRRLTNIPCWARYKCI